MKGVNGGVVCFGDSDDDAIADTAGLVAWARAQLIAIYTQHAASKLPAVDGLLEMSRGKEQRLVEHAARKYGVVVSVFSLLGKRKAQQKVLGLPGDTDWEERMAAVELLNKLRK